MTSATTIVSTCRARQTRVSKIEQYIAGHIDEELSLQTLANQFGMTPSYLSQYFHKKIGTCISERIASERVEVSKILLIETDMPIDQIAYKVGFNSPCTYRRQFRALTEMSPKAFRNAACN